MARFPGATWRGPVPNYTPGGMRSHRGLVLHIQQGSEAGTDAWFHNPTSQVSAHFGNPKSGSLEQWVSTEDRAWAEVSGNPDWISVENEGNSGDSLTPSQVENIAQLLAWLHTTYGVPLQVSDSTVPGLTGHGLGGSMWGGHYDCPGAPILAQRQTIVDRATAILGATTPPPTTSEDDMPTFATGEIPPGFAFDGAATDPAHAHTVLVPPANLGAAGWGNVWFSLGSDFGTPTVRVAAFIHGSGWVVKDDVAVPAAGDRVNPFGGPLPTGVQKISVGRRKAGPDDNDSVPLAWLVEAAHR